MNLYEVMSLETFSNDLLDSKPLIYRAYVPKTKKDKYKVFIFLHGAGERGNDGSFHVTPNADIIKNIINHPIYGEDTICIAPQVPKDETWMAMTDILGGSYDYDSNPVTPLQLMFNDFLVNELPKKYNIDKDNIFISGISMGASGAFDYLIRYPKMFRAAILICGIMDQKKLEIIKDIPLHLFHSKDDTTVPPKGYEVAYEKFKSMGSDVEFIEYLDAGHGSWRRAYKEPHLLDWLYSKSK